MASEKDDKKKTSKPAAAKADKPAAKAAAKPPAEKAAAAAPAAKPKAAAKAAKKVALPAGPPCRVEGCKQPSRAKGYCRKHFMAWRRGSVGDHHRYKICTQGRVPEAAHQGRFLRRARRHRCAGRRRGSCRACASE